MQEPDISVFRKSFKQKELNQKSKQKKPHNVNGRKNYVCQWEKHMHVLSQELFITQNIYEIENIENKINKDLNL